MTCRRGKISALLFFATLVALVIPLSSAYALDKYWIGSAGGNFSDDVNWATVAGPCGGVSDTTAPGASDIARFGGSCINDSAISASINVDGINIAAGYTGTITQAVGANIVIGNGGTGWNQSDGSFIGSNGFITIAAPFNLSGGSFAAPSSFIDVALGWFVGGSSVFDAGTGMVRLTSNGVISMPGTGVAVDDADRDFNNLEIVFGMSRTVWGAELEVDGTLTINTIAILDLDGANLDLNGTLNNIGELYFMGTEEVEIAVMAGGNAGLVTYDGTASTVLPAISAYGSLILNESGALNPVYTLPDIDVSVTGQLMVTDGTLAFDDDKNLTALGGISVAAQGAVTNTGIGDLVLGGDVNNVGTITFDAYGSGPGDANDISITSSAPGTRRNWQGAGTFSFADVDVTDQSVTGGSPASILDSSGSGSNNINWYFGGPDAFAGYVWQDKAKTVVQANTQLRLQIDNNLYQTTSNAGGGFNFTGISLDPGDSTAVYISGQAFYGVHFYLASGGTVGDIALVRNAYSFRDDSGSYALSELPGPLDNDMRYTVGLWPAFNYGPDFYVPAGTTVDADDVLAVSNMDIDGTLNASPNQINVYGSWDATGGIFNAGTSDVLFNSPGTITSGGADANHDFNDIWFLGNLQLAAANNLAVAGGLFIQGGGTLDNSNNTDIYLSGSWQNNGSFTSGTGTIYFQGNGALVTGGAAANKNFHHLDISGAANLLGQLDLDGDMTIEPSGTLDDSGSYSINVAGNWVNNGTFLSGTSTVTLDGVNQSIWAGGSGIAVDDATNDFYNLVIASTTTAWQELEVDNLLTINVVKALAMNGSTLDLNGTLSNDGQLALNGNESIEIGVMDTDSGKVTYLGPSATLPSAITTYYDLEINAPGEMMTLPDQHVQVNEMLSIQWGELRFDDDKNLTVDLLVTLFGTDAVLSNYGTGDLTLGGDIWTGSLGGNIVFDSSGGGSGDIDGIQIRSTVPGTQHNWQGNGSVSMTDVDVQDMTAIGGSPASITAADSTNSGNNVNWIFDSAPDAISGVAYTSKTEAATLNNKKLRLVHYNGAIRTSFDTTTDGSGNFSFNTIDLQAGDPLIIFVNDEAEEGNLVYVSDGNPVANLKLYQNETAIRTDFGAGLTNAELAAVDDGDADIHYNIAGGNATFETAYELYIFAGSTYAPGGTVSGGAFDLNGTFDAAGFNVTVNGNWDATGGAYTSGLNTTSFSSGVLTSGGVDDNHDFHNFTISSGTVTIWGSADIDGNVIVNGDYYQFGGTLTVAGDWTTVGTHNTSSTGIVHFDGNTTLDVGAQEFNQIYVTGNVVQSSSIRSDGGLYIFPGGLLDNTAGNSLNVGTGWTNQGTFISGNSTVTMQAYTVVNAGGSGIGIDDSANDFNNLVLLGNITLQSELEVDGTLTLSGGPLRLSGYALDLNGTFVNNDTMIAYGTEDIEIGVMDTDSGTVRYAGTASTTIPSGITTYFNLDFDESGTSDPTYTLPNVDISVNGALSVTDGTLALSPANNLGVSGATTIAAAGVLQNTGIGDFILGGDISNSGTISFDSSGAGPGDADDIQIRSTVPGTRRNWQGAGTFSITDVDVQDQSVIGGTPASISVTNGTNSGNNVNWYFDAGADSLGGIAYNGKAEAGTLNNKKLRVIHNNGSYNTTYDTTTDGAGAFTVSPLDLQPGDALLLFVNDEAEVANLAYVSDGNSVANLKIYQNEFAIRTDLGAGLTNAQLAALDDGDTDIRYNVVGGNATFETAYELYIFAGSTYVPGGTVSGGAFDLNGTFDAAGFDVTVNGNWDATGGAYVSGANTTTFAGTVLVWSGGVDDSHDFYNITIASGETALVSSTDIDGNVLIQVGSTIHLGTAMHTVAGNWTTLGGHNFMSSGGVNFDGVTQLDSRDQNIERIQIDGSVTLNSAARAHDGIIISPGGVLDDSGSYSIYVDFIWENSGTFVSGNSTVTVEGGTNIDAHGTALAVDDSLKDFYNITITGWTYLQSEMEVDGTLTLTGPLGLSGNNLDLNGTLVNNSIFEMDGTEAVEVGVMDTDSGIVRYTGTASTTIPSGISTYFNLDFDESGTSDPTYTLPAADITVNGALSVTDGTLALSPSNNLSVTGATTIAASGVLQNTGIGDLILGGSVTNSGVITFDSSGAGPGDADDIQIRSTVPGTRRNWQGSGTFSMTDIDVQDQSVLGGTPSNISVTNGTNSGNNVNWFFDAVPESLDGTVYNGKAEAATLNNKKLRVIHNNGSYNTTYDTVTDGAGAFTVSPLDLQAGDALLVFVNDEAEAANLAYVSDGNSVANLKVYQSEFAIRTDFGAGLTNAQLAALDDGDTDIRYAVTGGNATFETAYELYIFSGSTYLPGGTVSGGAFDLNGTLDAAGFDVTANGAWDATGGSYISGTNTTTFQGTSALIAGGTDNTHNFHDIVVGGVRTIGGSDLDVDGSVTINAASTLDSGGWDIYVAGNWTTNGTFNRGNDTVFFDGVSTINSGGTLPIKAFNQINIQGTVSLANHIKIIGGVSIQPGGNLNAGAYTVQLLGNWYNRGNFDAGTGQVWFNGFGVQSIDTVGSGVGNDDSGNDFYNLNVSGSNVELESIGGEIEVDNDLVIATGNLIDMKGSTLDLNGNLDLSGSLHLQGIEQIEIGTVLNNSGNVLYYGANNVTLPTAFTSYYRLTFNEPGVSNPVFTLPPIDITINSTLSVTDGTLALSPANNLTVAGATTIAAAGILQNTGAGDLILGADLSNSGAITFDSSGNGPGDVDDIQIRSTVLGTRRNWQGAGVFSMTDVDVQDQSVIGGTPASISVTNGTNSGNNVNWYFDAVPESLSGTVYNGKAELGTFNNKKVRIIHYNGSYTTTYDRVTDGSGAFSVSPIGLEPGDAVLVFLNDEAEDGNLVYISDGNSVGDLKVYYAETAIRTDFGAGLSNAQLAALDDSDPDILYSVAGADVVFDPLYEVYIFTGSTYLPGGKVTLGSIEVNGTFNADGNDVTLSGFGIYYWDTLDGSYISGVNTTTFAGSSWSYIRAGGVGDNKDFHNLRVTGGGTWTGPWLGPIDVDGNIEIDAGAELRSYMNTIYLAGDWTNNGSFVAFGGTLTFDGASQIDSGGVTSDKDFWDVWVTGIATFVNNSILVGHDVRIQPGGQLLNTNSLDIEVKGMWMNNGVFDSGVSTVTFSGPGQSLYPNGTDTATDDNGKDFYNFVITGASATLMGGELEVDGDLTISGSSTLSFTDNTGLTVAGAFNNSGTVEVETSLPQADIRIDNPDIDSGTFRFKAASGVSSTLPLSDFFNLEILPSAAGQAPTFTLADTDTLVRGTLSLSDPVTLLFDDNHNLTIQDTAVTSTALTVAANASLTNTGTGDLTLGGAVSNSGTISLDSYSLGGGDADDILIRSTVPGTKRNWQGSGTFFIADADVQDQSAVGGTPTDITVQSGTNSGNNLNWIFGADVGHSLTVTAYDSKAEGSLLIGKKVKVVIYDGAATSEFSGVTDVSGQIRVNSLDIQAGNTILAFLDDEVEEGNSVMVAAGGSIADMKLYAGELLLRSDGGNSLTSALLGAVDNTDNDVKYSVTGGNATFEAAFEVLIASGSVYAPGAAVTLGSIEIDGTFDSGYSGVIVLGNWNNVDGTYLGYETVQFNGTTTLISGGIGVGKVLSDMTIGNGAVVNISSYPLEVEGFFYIYGTLNNAAGQDLYIGLWSMENTGNFISGTSTVYITWPGAIIDSRGTGIAVDDTTRDFYNLVIASPIASAGSEIEVDGTLTINSSSTLQMSGFNLDLNGTLVNNGSLYLNGNEAIQVGVMDTDSGTVFYFSSGAVTIPVFTSTYYNLAIWNTGVTTLPDQNLAVNGFLSNFGGTVTFDNDKFLTIHGGLFLQNSTFLTNTGTGDLILSGDVSNYGTINFNSSDDAGNGIEIRSTVPGTRRNWQGTGAFNFTDVTVSDQTAIGGTPSGITTSSSSDNGNNVNWFFDGSSTLSGIAYADEAETTPLAGKDVWLLLEKLGVQTSYTTTTAGDGSFSFSGVTLTP
ncbi:MAG: hypothetical protein PHC51_08660, partial [bacterium]|nr:hypothetical protein [bacterium]